MNQEKRNLDANTGTGIFTSKPEYEQKQKTRKRGKKLGDKAEKLKMRN